MIIEEFTSQSFVGQENRRFHFDFKVTVDSSGVTSWLNLNPYEMNKGVFNFAKPLTIANTFSINFANTLQQLIFLPDRLRGTTNYGNPAAVTTTTNHGFVTGDYVIFDNFVTTDPVGVSAAVNAMTNLAGFSITVTGLSTFTVPIDLTSLQTTAPGSRTGTVAVTNGSTNIVGTGTLFDTEYVSSRQALYDIVDDLFYSMGLKGVTNIANVDVEMGIAFTGPTRSGLFYYVDQPGKISLANGDFIVYGDGSTTFLTTFAVGDYIAFRGADATPFNYKYRIDFISADDNLSLGSSNLFQGTTFGFGFGSYYKFTPPVVKIIPGMTFSSIAQSRRIQIPIEVTLNETTDD
jgi:hypothetical protein